MRFRSKHSVIGVEIGAAALRAVQLQRQGTAWSLGEPITLTRPDPAAAFDADEAQRLFDVMQRRGYAGRSVVVSLPNRDLIRGLFDVQNKDANDPFFAVAQDIERTQGLEPGTYELAAWLPPASGARRRSAVCVSGCTHAASRRVIEAFDAAGLEAVAIDSRACAAGRVVESPAHGLTAVLDIEHQTAELILLNDGNVVYQRPLIGAGLDQVHETLAKRGLTRDAADHCLNSIGLADTQNPAGQQVRGVLLAFVQNLVQEARPALDYAARVYQDLPIGGFALVGSGGCIPLLEFELRQQLALAPGRLHGPAALHDIVDAEYAIALGLALHPEEAKWAAA